MELGVNPVFAKTVYGADGTIGHGMDVSQDGIRVSNRSSHRTLKQAENRHALRQLAAISTIVLDPHVANQPGSTIVRKLPLREQVTAFLANLSLTRDREGSV